MAILKFKDIGIKAMSACVPSAVSKNSDLTSIMSKDEVDKMINSVGIVEKRIADEGVCASDLCVKAAEKLMADNNIDPTSIDMLLFMSQSSDYIIPSTSCIIQHRLGLPKTTACLDLVLGCSGYVYALSTAFAYASQEGINRILLLDGETFSKFVNPKDKVNAPLYGDAGTATLIEKIDGIESTFILHTDGGGDDAVKIKTGGCRNRVNKNSVDEIEREDGNIRSDIQLYMDGMDVFNFALSVVPRGVKELMKVTEQSLDDIDYVVFHQANKFMTDFFVKRLKLSSDKVPYCISKYGNTSSASVPLTIVSELEGSLIGKKSAILCGFGAGLSWGTASIQFKDCKISPIIEY